MNLQQRNSRKQGDVGLGSAIAYFTSLGWDVSIPLTDNQKYDLIVDNGVALFRIEIKTTTQEVRDGVFAVDLRTSGGNRSRTSNIPFDSKSCDMIFVLAGNDDRYVIPSCEIDAINSIQVGG